MMDVALVAAGAAIGLAVTHGSASLSARVLASTLAMVGVLSSSALVQRFPTHHPHARSERHLRALLSAVVLALAAAGVAVLAGAPAPSVAAVAGSCAVAWAALALVAARGAPTYGRVLVVAETESDAAELADTVGAGGVDVIGSIAASDRGLLEWWLRQRPSPDIVTTSDLVDAGLADTLVRHGGGRLLCVMAGRHAAKARLAPLGSVAAVDVSGEPLPPACRVVKRAVDVTGAALALVIAAPVLAVAAVAIRADSPGHWLFSQERVGTDGRRFRIYKLRTMHPDNDPARHRDYVARTINGTAQQVDGMYKLVGDERYTRVGRSLRRLSIDELPQLWNVVRGDMSLVGPRPPLPHEVEVYPPEALGRLAIRPGITGLWQVSGRSRLSFERMLELDLEYWRQWTLLLDLRILARTPVVALLRRETA